MRIELSDSDRELIKKEAGSAEKLGKLTDKQLDIIYKNRWFHLLVPKGLGGAEMSLPEFAEFMEVLAEVDGGFAWNVNLGAGANMFAGFMDQTVAARIFANEKTCVAGSGAVSGTAKKQDGGYVINGHWKYASGSAHANYFSLNATLVDEGNDQYVSFLVPADDVEVLDTWKAFGMKATSSHDFKVNNVWVPEEYLFDLQKPSPTVDSTLYRFPFKLLAEINMVVMLIGLTKRFEDIVIKRAEERVFASMSVEKAVRLTTDPSFMNFVGDTQLSFIKSRAIVSVVLESLWDKVEKRELVSEELSTEFSRAINNAAVISKQLVDQLYSYAGMGVIFEDTEMSRIYRDFKVVSQHALLSPAATL